MSKLEFNQSTIASIENGGKVIAFPYCYSLIFLTSKKNDLKLVESHESRLLKAVPYMVLTLLMGWWGFPWGPIYSVSSLFTLLRGGKDVTSEFMNQWKQMSLENALEKKLTEGN